MQRRVVGHGAWRCDDDDVAARRRPEELGRGEGAANAVDVRTLFAARDQIEERGAARLEALVQAAVESLRLQAERMPGLVGLRTRVQVRIEQDQVVAPGRALQEVAAVADEDP